MLFPKLKLRGGAVFFPNWLPAAIFTLALIGFGDAAYLTVKHFLGAPVTCSILQGCDKVLTSQYAVIFGLPVALLGALYYFSILILSGYCLFSGKGSIMRFVSRFVALGFIASLWFVYLQVFVINDLCEYCLLSAITSTALFVFGFLVREEKPVSVTK